MREIKFRAWDNIEERMLPVENINFREQHISLDEGDNSVTDTFEMFELTQFIGVRDKHGTEIYEGDIVTAHSEGYCGKFEIKMREDGGGSPTWLLYPAWQNYESWCIKARREEDGLIYDRGLEIIGNIYENKNLLRGV